MDKMAYAEQFNKAMQYFISTLPEEKALVVAGIYEQWKIGVKYTTGEWVVYGTNSLGDPQLYQVLQDHTSAAEWTPDTATSLYKAVGIDPSGIPLWVQPLGATDAYNIGDIVSYNGKLYKSIINANVWAPDVYPAGWEEYTESTGGGDSGETGGGGTTEPETPPAETIPDFVQPTGAHDAYKKGDRVKYNGKVYESLIDGNAYSPDAYPAGWQEVTE